MSADNNLLERQIQNIYDTFEIPVISVLNHSPAYHFPGLPEPIAKTEQKDALPVCFWPQFDWHVMFARAIARANPKIGFVCVRPDERAKEPVFYLLDKNVLMVHFPSEMERRIVGAMCIEQTETMINFLNHTLSGRNFLLMIMGIGTPFGKNVLQNISNRVPDVPILGYAAGDIPSVYSRSMLADLLYSSGLVDRLRFIKHAIARIVGMRKEKALYSSLAHLWAPTRKSNNHWREVLDCPISFAPGGYGYDGLLWKPGNKESARKTLNLQPDVPVVLSSSVLIPKKKLDDLIQACVIVKKRIGNLKLIITGYGESAEKQRLQNIVKRLDFDEQVLFTDYVTEKDLVLYYQAADAFVHLSGVEGGPASAMQALATNTPLVMTPVGCVGELLQISNLGRLFPVGDIAACAKEIIETLKSDDRPATSDFAYELWSWDARGKMMAADIEEKWRKAMKV